MCFAHFVVVLLLHFTFAVDGREKGRPPYLAFSTPLAPSRLGGVWTCWPFVLAVRVRFVGDGNFAHRFDGAGTGMNIELFLGDGGGAALGCCVVALTSKRF